MSDHFMQILYIVRKQGLNRSCVENYRLKFAINDVIIIVNRRRVLSYKGIEKNVIRFDRASRSVYGRL